jgi:hypothetical protein
MIAAFMAMVYTTGVSPHSGPTVRCRHGRGTARDGAALFATADVRLLDAKRARRAERLRQVA